MGVGRVHTQVAVALEWPFQSATSLGSPMSGASWVPGRVTSSVPQSRVTLPFSPDKLSSTGLV